MQIKRGLQAYRLVKQKSYVWRTTERRIKMIQLFSSHLFSSVVALSDCKEIKVSKQNIDNKNIHQKPLNQVNF